MVLGFVSSSTLPLLCCLKHVLGVHAIEKGVEIDEFAFTKHDFEMLSLQPTQAGNNKGVIRVKTVNFAW